MRRLKILTLLALLCLPLALAAQTSTTSQVSGTVQDPSGAAVPGAQVQITNTNTNAVRTTTTSGAGYYVFPSLPIGPYTLQVSKPGFTTYAQTGIVLQVNTNPTINVTLKVGAVTQTVQVTANAAMVETESTAGLGQVIQPEQVLNLPLNGRQETDLIALSGAAVNTQGSGGTVNTLDYPTAVSYSIAGSQVNATNYFLDGAINQDFRTNVGEPLPFPDALEEFKVQSSALPADAGSRPGGTVNAVIKSGTNGFHGDLFEYLRNTAMDALIPTFTQSNGATPPAKPDNLKRNQFGGVIGGPIVKNKLFFFEGLQGTIERVLGNTVVDHVPTAATLSGDFRAMLAPPCQSKQVFLNSAFTTAPDSNIIQPSLMSTSSAQVAAKLAKYLPPATDACGTVSYQLRSADNEYQNVSRIDWQRTQNDHIFGSYFITNYTLATYYPKGNLLAASAPGLDDRVQNIVLGDTHILSPTMISSLRLSFERTATVRSEAPGIPTWQALGSNVTTQWPDYLGQNSVSGYFGLTIPGFPGYDYENTYGISELIDWTKGMHQMSFGFEGLQVQMNNDGLFQVNPNFSFTGSVTGNALADFLTGNPGGFHQGNGQLGRDVQFMPSLFFEDNWKVARTFQLDLGLRWDPFYAQYNRYDQVTDFNLAAYNAGAVSTKYPGAPPGVTFTGDPGFHGRSDSNNQIWDFGPRIGFVWDPGGKGRQAIRGGYGIFYNTSTLWNTMHVVLNPPWGETLSFTPETVAQGGGLANPWAGTSGNPFPSPINPPSSFAFPVNGTYIFENQNIQPTNVQQWNLSYERQFGENWMVSAAYLGSKTTHQWLGYNLNPATIITPGMTAPGIVSDAGVNGLTGSCILNYGGVDINWPVCNGQPTESATVTLPGQTAPIRVTNEASRAALVLANPTAGPLVGGGLTEAFSDGNASYNGLLLTAQHRLSQNLSVLTNFTWSHCLSQGSIGQDIGNSLQNPSNRRANWGSCSADRRRIYNLSLIAGMPGFNNGSRLLREAVAGWHGSGIFTASSGAPLNVTDGQDVSFTGVLQDRPDALVNPFTTGSVGSCTPPSVPNARVWFNPCAFAAAPYLSYGSYGRNGLLGPGNWNFDAAIWKDFPLTERYQLEFRAEAFNVFNHLEIGDPSTGIYSSLRENISNPASPVVSLTRSPSTAFITSAANNQRILQLALKLTF
jgi:hypothetical protein